MSINFKGETKMKKLAIGLCIAYFVMFVPSCTSVHTFPMFDNKEYVMVATLGVAHVEQCEEMNTQQADGSIFFKKNCIVSTSSGFTGWKFLDALVSGFISFVTFGAVAL